jgi:hypothetical protein
MHPYTQAVPTTNQSFLVQLYTMPFLLLIPQSSKEASSALPPVLSNHWAQVHSLIHNDPVNQMLPMFSSKWSPMSSTSYLEISTRRVPMQPECHSPWLLLSVCTYPVYMTLLYCEISLMHRPLHIMYLVCTKSLTEIDHDATMNMINMLYVTPRS